MTHETRRGRIAAAQLTAAGLLFALFPLVRPFPPAGGDTLAQFTDTRWIVAHLAGAAAFVLVVFAFTAQRVAPRATALLGVGVAPVLLYFGAETFALHELGVLDSATALDLAERIRTGQPQATLFAVGLLLVAVGVTAALLVAVRAGRLPTAPAVVLAAGFLLYIPQFFTSPTVRLAHGILVLVGCVWVGLRFARPNEPDAAPAESSGPPPYSDRSTTTGA